VWDDHEISNNGYRDGSSGLNNTEESFVKDGGVSVDQRKGKDFLTDLHGFRDCANWLLQYVPSLCNKFWLR
jgi:hypothetical protein